MSDLFPFFADVEVDENKQLSLYKEVAWDFKRNLPLVLNGEFIFVTGNEAIKTWCYKALQINRYNLIMYSWNYGSELETLIGKPYSKALAQAECTRFVEECLMINPYITGISNVQSKFENGLLSLSCNLVTVYGETSLNEVRINV
ncbi:MAG: DUF2634 domain-containing protein [Oscillospiraceae bacterium]